MTRLLLLSLALAATASAQVQPSFVFVPEADSPFDGFAFNTGSGPSPTFGDLDGDGDDDIMVGAVNGTIRYYTREVDSNGAIEYVERTGAANPLGNLDFGTGSRIVLADMDADGDLDAITGVQTAAFPGSTILYYENIGTATAPRFDAPTRPTSYTGDSAPSLGDADNDGDLDMVVRGTPFLYFENTGSATSATFVQRTGSNNPLDGLSSPGSAVSRFADVDQDGDEDLLVIPAARGAKSRFYENTGTAGSPGFTERTGAANPFDAITFVSPNGTPGAEGRGIAFGDVDGNDLPDLILAGRDNRVTYYRNVAQPVANEDAPSAALALAVWPNPTAGAAAVSFELAAPGRARLSVYDALGRQVALVSDAELGAGTHRAEIGAGLAPGVYLVRLATASGASTRTLTVVR